MPVDLQRVLSDEVRRNALVDISLNCPGPKERLAQTNQPFIRVDLHPQQIRKLIKSQRLDLRHLHRLDLNSKVPSPLGSGVPIYPRRVQNPALTRENPSGVE